MTLSTRWAGGVFGTHTGNLFLEFDGNDFAHEVGGILRVREGTSPVVVVYTIRAHFDGELRISASPTQIPEGITAEELTIVGKLTPEGNLRGTWSAQSGAGGAWVAFPHDAPAPFNQNTPDLPEQFFSSTRRLGALRLYRTDVARLVDHLKKELPTGRPIVTYVLRGNEVTQYYDDFLRQSNDDVELRRFKLHIQEPEMHGILRIVTLDLNQFGVNELRIQAISESWVLGQAETLVRLLKDYESSLVTTYKHYGLSLNSAIFVCMLIFTPSISSIGMRAAFTGAVVVLLAVLLWLHSKFIPVLIVYPSRTQPSFFSRIAPSLLSWFIAVSSGVAAAVIFAFVQKLQ